MAAAAATHAARRDVEQGRGSRGSRWAWRGCHVGASEAGLGGSCWSEGTAVAAAGGDTSGPGGGAALWGHLTRIACLPFACPARALSRGFTPLLLFVLSVSGTQKVESPWTALFSYSFRASARNNEKHVRLYYTYRGKFPCALSFYASSQKEFPKILFKNFFKNSW